MAGYISQYKKQASRLIVDDDIFGALYEGILESCYDLIENGYKRYLSGTDTIFLADETQITAGLYGQIENIIKADRLPFDVVPEYFVYSDDIKKGKQSPKKAKRFDLRLLTWNRTSDKFYFGVEAKLLAETNYKNKTASFLIKEYVEDAGMGKFINNLYDRSSYNEGFMLGHLLNGTVEGIVGKINERIDPTYSENERLSKSSRWYISNYNHNGIQKKLYHMFLDFSMLFH